MHVTSEAELGYTDAVCSNGDTLQWKEQMSSCVLNIAAIKNKKQKKTEVTPLEVAMSLCSWGLPKVRTEIHLF